MEQENNLISKKQFVLSMLLITVISFILFLSIYLMLNQKINKLSKEQTETVVTVFKETEEPTIKANEFIIKEFDGKIGVFKNGDFQYSIDVYTFTLPEEDKNLLSQGIEVSSEQEVNDILSCYY